MNSGGGVPVWPLTPPESSSPCARVMCLLSSFGPGRKMGFRASVTHCALHPRMASARAVGHRRPQELGLGLEEPPLDLLRHLNLGPTAPCQSRFVGRSPAGNSMPTGLGTRPPASTVRAQAALSRLARLEDRLRGRRPARSSSATPTSSDSQLSSDAPSRAPNPPDPAQGAPGNQPRSRFLKKRGPSAETTRSAVLQGTTRPSAAPPAPCGPPDSDEEEVAYLLGSLAESSEGKGPAGKPVVVSTRGPDREERPAWGPTDCWVSPGRRHDLCPTAFTHSGLLKGHL